MQPIVPLVESTDAEPTEPEKPVEPEVPSSTEIATPELKNSEILPPGLLQFIVLIIYLLN